MGEIVKNSFALITGASAGIGKQFAIECAKRSLNLFLISLPDTGLESLEIELKGEYQIEIHTLCIDLTSKNAPMKVHHYAMQNNIVVSILVNNAGVGFDGKLENLSVDLIDEMILLNVRASTLLTFLFLPEMKKLRKAYILNISSFSALTPLPNKCVYAATKSYLLYLTNAINYELKGTSVHALSVHPSGVSSERNLESIQRSSFIARISTLKPEEVAQLSIKNLLAGKKFIVPGTVTKIYYYLGLLLPTFIVLPIVSKVFRKTN
jgi:uncharacterized protein